MNFKNPVNSKTFKAQANKLELLTYRSQADHAMLLHTKCVAEKHNIFWCIVYFKRNLKSPIGDVQ